MYLQLCISSVIYIAFKVYMSSANAFPGNRTTDFGVASNMSLFFPVHK